MGKTIYYFRVAILFMLIAFIGRVEAKAAGGREVRSFTEFQEALADSTVTQINLEEDIYQMEEDAAPLIIPRDITIEGDEYILSLNSQGIILEGNLTMRDCDLRFGSSGRKSIILNYHELVLDNVTTRFSNSIVDIYAGTLAIDGYSLYHTGNRGVVILSGNTHVDNIYAGNFSENEVDYGKIAEVTIIITSPWVQTGTIDCLIGDGKTSTLMYEGNSNEAKSIKFENAGNLEVLSGHLRLTPDSYFYNDRCSLLVEGEATLDLSQMQADLRFLDYVGEGKLLIGEHQRPEFSGYIEEEVRQEPIPIPVYVSRIIIEDKLYDGNIQARIKEIAFSDGVNHNLSISYEAVAHFTDANVGTGKDVYVTVTLKNPDYQLTQKQIYTKGNILKKPETVTPQQKVETRIDVKVGFTANGITPQLREKGFDSVLKIEDALYIVLKNLNMGFEAKNSRLYEVNLLARKSNNEGWRKAEKQEFPLDGRLRIRIAAPEGTDVDNHDYTVLHMFGDNQFYRTAGHVENPWVTEIKQDGKSFLEFEIIGTSPFLVAWKNVTQPITVVTNPQPSNQPAKQPLAETKEATGKESVSKEAIREEAAGAERLREETSQPTVRNEVEESKPEETNYAIFFLVLGICTVALIAVATGIVILKSK